MKTRTWNPGEASTRAGSPAQGPLDWLATPLVFTTLRTAPAELELVSGLYQVMRHHREGVPFTLEMRTGELLVSFSKDEFFVADEFKLPLQVFEKVMGLERTMAIHETLNTLQARVDALDAAREVAALEAQRKVAGTQASRAAVVPAAKPSDDRQQETAEAADASSITATQPESKGSSDDIRSMLSGPPPRQSRAGTNRRRS